ncbi:hypothetical protein ACOMHN_007332 [Nucella lapillus]
MAMTGVRDGFELDDHGILRDSFASDFQVDEDGILHDDLDLLKHAITTTTTTTTSHGTDSGINGDKPPSSSPTSTLQHLHTASFDEDLAPVGDESVNISDFEASRDDDLDSTEGDLDGDKRSMFDRGQGGMAETRVPPGGGGGEGKGQDLFSEEYYQQLRELGVLVDGADFSSRDEWQNDLDSLLQAQDGGDYTEDLIGEYLEEGDYGKGAEEGKSANSQATSAASVSAFSDDMDVVMYNEVQNADNDDNEIFLINRHLLPGSSNIQAEKLRLTPSDHGSRPNSTAGRTQSPRSGLKRNSYRSKQSPSPSESGQEMYSSRSNTPLKTRPDSAVSFTSAASESVCPQSGASTPAKSSMSKARSQESFFGPGKQLSLRRSGERGPKRLLPQPSSSDPRNGARGKSKSVSNIANRSAPLKPTHMSISEITRLTLDDAGDAPPAGERTVDRSEGELSTQLKQESSKRKQATELVQQLQKEYDSLLSKYALAELTIDHMRLGARISLNTDSPTPSSGVPSGGMSPSMGGHKAQMFQVLAPSAQRAVAGSFSAASGDHQTHASTQSQTADARARTASAPTSAEKTLIAVQNNLEVGGQGSGGESESRTSVTTAGSAETVKVTVHTETASLDDRLNKFQTLVDNRQLTIEEQEKALENIRTDHEKLRRVYLQAKEDYNVLRRSDADFDQDKELEGVLFRFGMKFDEIYAKVDSNLKQQGARRQPFLSTRLTEDQRDDGIDDVDQGKQQEGATQDGHGRDAEIEKRAVQLHEEYRALMDRYRRLKQMAPTPELDKETDNLVRKLNSICIEMPDMFRLSSEVQERWEKLQRRDLRRSSLPQHKEGGAVGGTKRGDRNDRPSVSATSKARSGGVTPLLGDHSISPFPSRHRHDSRDSRFDDSFSRTPSSLSGSRSSLASPRDPNSSMTVNRSSPSPRGVDRGGSPSSLDGAAAPRSHDVSFQGRLNRPRHHHHHHFRDPPKSSKRPERESLSSSLADSGLSDQDEARGGGGGRREHRHDDDADALAQLPGPGKMKQMTHQRRETDVDSGFVGSMVSSEGAQPLPLPPSHDHQPEATLRLREPGRPSSSDRNPDHARRDSTASSSTVTSTRRDSGGSEHRSRRSKPQTTQASTSAGAGQHSIDRSYDGELDESTLSHVQSVDPWRRGARPKEPSKGPKVAGKEEVRSPGKVMGSRTSRSHSDSMLDDETLEDMNITDVSTPRLIETATTDTQKPSTQPSQTSELLPPRPPTPQELIPSRPPTPYRVEPKEESAEGETNLVEMPPVDEKTPHQEQKQQQQQQQQESAKSSRPASTQQKPAPAERPESRGEPTTDLYHTRSRRERKRDRAESVTSLESARPGSLRGRRGSDSSLRARGEDCGVGSDVEVGSDFTRVSSGHSARLRAMQDEIEKLKHGVQMAHDKASERPEPPPPLFPPPQQQQQQQQPEGPEYYDPFDDPYGFMRMPRRRANSFSGGRERMFDEWYWTLPNDRRKGLDDDIPLGYAAADAYNRHYHSEEKTPEAARQRLRHRRDRRHHVGEAPPPPTLAAPGGGMGVVVNGEERRGVVGAPLPPPTIPIIPTAATVPSAPNATFPSSAPSPAQIRRHAALPGDAQYNYYVPRRTGRQTEETLTPNPNLNPYRQHTTPLSTSQPPSISQTLAGVEPPTSYQSVGGAQQGRPWYTIRRSPWVSSSAAAASTLQHPQGYQPAYHYYHQPESSSVGYYSTSESGTGQGGTGYWADACPLCGGSGTHAHHQRDDDGQLSTAYGAEAYYGYPSEGRSQRRSRSVPRSRHYMPEGRRSRHSYHVREVAETDSDDFDDWARGREHRRSRSWSRHRSGSRSRRSVSGQGNRRKRQQLSLQGDDDLNESLQLSEDISRLTKRMMGTVRGELNRHS